MIVYVRVRTDALSAAMMRWLEDKDVRFTWESTGLYYASFTHEEDALAFRLIFGL